MNNWQKVRLKDVVSILGDGLHGTPKYDEAGEYFFINGNNLSDGQIKIKSDTKRVNVSEYLKHKKDLNDRTLLVSINGTIGNVATYKGEKCILGKSACYFNILPGVCKEYIYYILLHDNFQSYAKNWATGTTIKNVSLKQMREYEFLLPSFEKQQQIAKILSSLDDKIELNAQINHNLEEQLYALYASNYDNLSGKKVPLKECCSFQEGYVNPTQTKPEYFDGSVKWLRAVDINESFIISTSRTLTEQGFASAGKSALLFPKDSIAISKSGTIGRLGIVADNMCGNRAVINIVPKQKKWLAFIYCYLKSRQAEFSDLAVGSVQKNLYVSILEPLEIFSPADSVLNDFHFSAQTILEKMKNNCFEMQSLAQLRDALLPKLMSGEIDVSEVEV